MQGFEAADLVKRHFGNHRRAARAVGAQDDAFDVFHLVSRFHAFDDFGGGVVGAVYGAVDVDDGGVGFAQCTHVLFTTHHGGNQAQKQQYPHAAPQPFPQIGTLLLLVHFQQQFFEGALLPSVAFRADLFGVTVG